jgi:Na+/proline symporter
VWAGTRIKNTSDFAVAGRSLPLIMVITTTFATWFGAETVMGVPAKFVQGGLNAVIEDPFGAGTCLILVGLFFATKLYKLNLLTIGDYYRERYGKGIEIFCSVAIILSYLGWVAAQITALGLVFSVLTNGAMAPAAGMVIGTLAVLIYVVVGGFLAVALTDFIQMIVLVIGMSIIAFFAADLAGGAGRVFDMAQHADLWRLWPEPTFSDIIFFFGALLSAIKSTSSATLLAPSTSFTENILKNLRPGMNDKQQLFAMRMTIVVFAALVLAYAIAMEGTSIYELVSSAYQVTLVAAFVPLVMGLYWKRATTQGAIFSIGAGLFVWILFFPQISSLGEHFPGQLAGLLAAFAGMFAGSLAPQVLKNRTEKSKTIGVSV